MNIISFSLWGDNPKYTVGAIRNAELANQIYPGWICRFYVANDVPLPIIFNLEQFQNVQVVRMNEAGNWKSMFWRFYPASEEDVDIMISRDTDSRLNHREKEAVAEWINSDSDFHIMRDHPAHGFPILGGMWGAKRGAIQNIRNLISEFGGSNQYGTDYVFFQEKVFPHLQNPMVHDEFFAGKHFPSKRKGYEFVGEVFDHEENNTPEHTEALKEFLNRELYIHHHLGIGDHIDCNGMVRWLLKHKKFSKIHVFVKEKYFNLIDYMYRDEDRICLIQVPNDKEYEFINNFSKTNHIPILKIGHENYPWGREQELGKGCAELFYEQIKMPFDIRFSYFYYERDTAEESRVYKKLNPAGKPFVFVHDDPSRGFTIDEDKIRQLAGEDIVIIRNDMSENIFYYGKIFEEAKQIHCMESCFRSFAETLDIKGDLYLHNFRDGASGFLGNSTKQPWKHIVS
jgi:hypothetical protein